MLLTGNALFGPKVDETLQQLKNDNEKAKAMGALTIQRGLQQRDSFHKKTKHKRHTAPVYQLPTAGVFWLVLYPGWYSTTAVP